MPRSERARRLNPFAAPRQRSRHHATRSASPPRRLAAIRALPRSKGTTYRKLARGRLPLEASIDLHGLTQSQAYGLLYGFIARAHAKGLRHVLVVTGKGASSGSDGVLRRAVPHWLRTPEFRGMASGCGSAACGHGGDGAFYVRLRRSNR